MRIISPLCTLRMKDNLIRWPMCACRRTGGVHPWWLGRGGLGVAHPPKFKIDSFGVQNLVFRRAKNKQVF